MSDNPAQSSCPNGAPSLKMSTIVFLDFEATGLRRPRITELCLLAVSRTDLCSGRFPRVTNKLVLCVDPQKPIDPVASFITGLYNDNLEYQRPWSADTVQIIDCFLRHLAEPICLVAHNGNGFDFPLLLSELQRVNQSLKDSLYCADSLECFRELDGLPRKYVLQSNGGNTPMSNTANTATSATVSTPPSLKLTDTSAPPPVKRKMADNLPLGSSKLVKSNRSDSSTANVKKRLDFEETEVNDVVDSSEAEDGQKRDCMFSDSLEDRDYLMALDMVEKEFLGNENSAAESDKDINDTVVETESCTPDRMECTGHATTTAGPVGDAVTAGTGYMVCNEGHAPDHLQQETSPLHVEAITQDHSSRVDVDEAIENKPHDSNNDAIQRANKDDPSKVTPIVKPVATTSTAVYSPASVQRKSYKLEEIFARTLGIPPDVTHCAEADSIMLMKISTKVPEFLNWIDKNAVPLSSLSNL